MRSKLDPEDRILEDLIKEKEEEVYLPKLEGYACPYPRRKFTAKVNNETSNS